MLERGIPRQHYEILDESGQAIGTVTSGTISPSMNTGIGLGYIRSEHALPGTLIRVRIRNKDLQAKVVTLPIYKKDQIVNPHGH
jgi:aminomethyltransferase